MGRVRRRSWLLALFALLAPAAGAAAPLRGFTMTTVAGGLADPTAAAFAPDGRLLILEKAGAVRVWTPSGGLATQPLATLAVCTKSEMGLLGLAYDPAFQTNGFLYLYATIPPGGNPGRCDEVEGRENQILRVTIEGDRIDLATTQVLLAGLRTDNGNHDGGALRVGPDGLLYAGSGDTGRGDRGRPGQATNPYARDLDSLNGKILRLARDGSPAPGNPFRDRGGAAAYVFASGLRNPFRFDFDPRTGLLWVGDVGQNTFEEVDVVRVGDDLGWPRCEARAPRGRCPGPTVPPVHVYRASADGASVTGGVFYEGTALGPASDGAYFFGDFVFDVVWRARLDPSRTRFAGRKRVVLRNAGAPVDFTVGPDGALYYVAFSAGAVRRITFAGGS